VLGFPKLFSHQLGKVRRMVCQLDLTDDVPVRSRPYQCSPPGLRALREIVNDLLEKGAVKKSFSQYASPAFLVPKPQGGYRMVIDYRLFNKKGCLLCLSCAKCCACFCQFSRSQRLFHLGPKLCLLSDSNVCEEP
jgi:hypothetical protein